MKKDLIVECTYCGINANCLDHIIPVSYNNTSRKGARYSKELTVPCCNECNAHLSNLWYPTISERAGYLLERYNKKYDKVLNQPTWESWELEELSGNLKKMIVSNAQKKLNIEDRLSFLLDVYNKTLTPYDVWDKYPDETYNRFKN